MNIRKTSKMKTIKLENISIVPKKARRELHKDQLIEVTDVNGDIAYATDLKSVAEVMHCTPAAVSHVLNGRAKSLKGCSLRWVDMKDIWFDMEDIAEKGLKNED